MNKQKTMKEPQSTRLKKKIKRFYRKICRKATQHYVTCFSQFDKLFIACKTFDKVIIWNKLLKEVIVSTLIL